MKTTAAPPASENEVPIEPPVTNVVVTMLAPAKTNSTSRTDDRR